MEWVIDYLEKDGIVYAKTSGVMDWDSNKKLVEELFATAREHNSHKFLVDQHNTEANFSILEIDDMPKLMSEAGMGPEDKIAVLFNPSWEKDRFSFFSNLSQINSLQFAFFSDKDKAIDWLKSK